MLAQYTVGVNTPNVLSDLNVIYADGYSSSYDAISYNGSPVVAYVNQSQQLAIVYNGNTYTSTLAAPQLATYCIATTIDSNNILWVAVSGFNAGFSEQIYVFAFSLNTLSFTLTNVLSATETIYNFVSNMTIVENPQSRGSILICDELNGGTEVNIWQLNALAQNINIVNGFPVAWKTVVGVGLASKAFINKKNAFVNVIWESKLQSTYFTCCLTSGLANAPISKFNPQVGGNVRTNQLLAQCDIYNKQAGTFLVAAQRAGMFVANGNTTYTTLGLNANFLNFDHPNSFNSVVNTNNLIITGGIAHIYDGTSVVEDNFNIFPEGTIAAVVPDLQGGLDGYYQYIITYEWSDQFGQIQRSTPSTPVLIGGLSIFAPPGNSVILTIPTLKLTAKQNPRDPVQIVIYRTQAQGSVYTKVASIPNDLTVLDVSYIDLLSDAAIAPNLPGYWQSQVYNSAPPSCNLICNYANRVCISGLDDINLIWFSQNRFDISNFNTIPNEFSNLFTIGCDPYGDNGLQGITAIQKMDNNLVIFKKNSIFIVNSDGPQPTGGGDNFPSPTLVTSDTGCDDPNSIAFCPLGLLFKSDKGIYLLQRDGSGIVYIGAPVADFNHLTITSAQLLVETNEVIFTTLEGTILCWNYYFNAPQGYWTTWTYIQAADSIIWKNQLVVAQENGVCLVQDNTNTIYTDNGRPVIRKVQLPWLGAGMQRWCMVYNGLLLGNFKGPHVLQGYIEYNYMDGIVEDFAINRNMVTNQWGTIPTWG